MTAFSAYYFEIIFDDLLEVESVSQPKQSLNFGNVPVSITCRILTRNRVQYKRVSYGSLYTVLSF